ncbi:hypothetical protein ES703_82161 [subsurface metagenome]
MEYSAVIQPVLLPFRNIGIFSSIVAVAMTLVLPISIRAEPSEKSIWSSVIVIGLNVSEDRLFVLIFLLP